MRTKPKYRIEFYRDRKKEWRWRAVHRNGRIIADSGEGYKRPSKAFAAVENFLLAAVCGLVRCEAPGGKR